MLVCRWLVSAVMAVSSVLAAPAPAAADSASIPAPPFALPARFPIPSITDFPSPFNLSGLKVPTHFGLFGYSFDGTIFNQSYYADGQPYNPDLYGFLNRPEDAYKNQTFGSYAFGIGTHRHLFAMNDGRIATTEKGASINWVLFESWRDWWQYLRSGEPAEPLPTCAVVPFFDLLVCELDGKPFKFAYCKDGVPEGVGYTAGTVVWGTDIAPCTEIVVHVKQVPKTYGNQFPEQACPAYPFIDRCKGKGGDQ